MTCEWPFDSEAVPEDWETIPAAFKTRGIALASSLMERFTGGRVRVCPITVEVSPRFQCEHEARDFGHGFERPYRVTNWGGRWGNSCGCTIEPCSVRLPAPIGRIDEVKVAGLVIDESLYQVIGDDTLRWTGTGDCPFTERVQVTYVNGYDPGPDGSYAMTVLAYEFGRAMAGERCRLPAGVTSVVRQGISMTIVPGSFPDGKTGITEVDAYVSLWNPRNIDQPVVWSPDLPEVRTIRS